MMATNRALPWYLAVSLRALGTYPFLASCVCACVEDVLAHRTDERGTAPMRINNKRAMYRAARHKTFVGSESDHRTT